MVTTAEPGSSWAEISAPQFGMVQKDMVLMVWPAVVEILREKAQEWLQTVSEEEVLEWLLDGRAELWLGTHAQQIEGFVIGHWEIHAKRRRYCILYIAGSGLEKYIRKGLETLEHYCAILGGTELVLEGRKGWSRWLKRYGYHQDTVRLRKSTSVLWRN